MRGIRIAALALACAAVLVSGASADQVVLKQGVGGYVGAADTYIDSQNPTGNSGNAWYMHLYMYNDDPRRSALLKYDLTGRIPPNAVISSATLSIWLYQVVDMDSNDWVDVAPFRVGVHRDWVESQATWNVFRGSTYWSAAGCEGWQWGDRSSTADCAPIRFTRNSQVNRYYHWDVTSSVRAWYGGTANNGWLLRITAHDGVAGEGISFDAKEGSESYRPSLTISYSIVPEPCSLLALVVGMAGLLAARRGR